MGAWGGAIALAWQARGDVFLCFEIEQARSLPRQFSEVVRLPSRRRHAATSPREELAAGKERELQKREAALAAAEQRVAALTRRLEADLQLSAASPNAFAGPTASTSTGTAARGQLAGSFEGMRGSYEGVTLQHTSVPRSSFPAGSSSKQTLPSRLASQQQQAAAPAQPASQQQSRQAPSGSTLSAAHTSGTFATPASSLLRTGSLDTVPQPNQQQQQEAPNSEASTAAGGGAVAAMRRDSFASLDGTPDRQASLAAALMQLQASTDKGAHRWADCSHHVWLHLPAC